MFVDRGWTTPGERRLHRQAAHARKLRRKLSHYGASMTGRHTCKPSTIKARFRAGVCRTSTFATVCTAQITSPRRPCGFRQLFCLTMPPPLAPLIKGWANVRSRCDLCTRPVHCPTGTPRRTRFEVSKPRYGPQSTHRDRAPAPLFIPAGTASIPLGPLNPGAAAANIVRACGIAPLPVAPCSELK
jgi:hypothetical protein